MTSTKTGLLYLFAKPPVAMLPAFGRLRALLAIESGYALARLHCTLLPLGETTPALIETTRAALSSFHVEPFDIAFDHVEGSTPKPRKRQRAPGMLHRALARHFAIQGFAQPDYDFGLHLNLDYGTPSDRRAAIAPIGWRVDEILLVESGNGEHRLHARHSLFVRQYALAL